MPLRRSLPVGDPARDPAGGVNRWGPMGPSPLFSAGAAVSFLAVVFLLQPLQRPPRPAPRRGSDASTEQLLDELSRASSGAMNELARRPAEEVLPLLTARLRGEPQVNEPERGALYEVLCEHALAGHAGEHFDLVLKGLGDSSSFTRNSCVLVLHKAPEAFRPRIDTELTRIVLSDPDPVVVQSSAGMFLTLGHASPEAMAALSRLVAEGPGPERADSWRRVQERFPEGIDLDMAARWHAAMTRSTLGGPALDLGLYRGLDRRGRQAIVLAAVAALLWALEESPERYRERVPLEEELAVMRLAAEWFGDPSYPPRARRDLLQFFLMIHVGSDLIDERSRELAMTTLRAATRDSQEIVRERACEVLPLLEADRSRKGR